jgi:hypothetical protein
MPDVPVGGEIPADGQLPLFVQLSDVPVSGIGVLETGNSVRFVERERGYVYELNGLDKSSTRRITNTTILGAQEVLFGNGGTTVVVRHLESGVGGVGHTIKTFAGRIYPGEGNDAPGSIDGAYLPDNILEVGISPGGNLLAMVIPTENGSSIRVADMLDRKTREIARNPLREWLPYPTNDGDVLLASKATYDAPGYLLELGGKSGEYRRIVGGKIGMTALPSPDGNKALFSEYENGVMGFFVGGIMYGEQGEATTDFLSTGLLSLAQKCVWSNDAIYAFCASFSPVGGGSQMPDGWYQGTVSTNDSFWRIDTRTGETELLGDPYLEIGRYFDATNLTVSFDRSVLYFINKSDGMLWGMRIQKNISGGEVTEETVPPTAEELRDIEGSAP